MSLLDLFSGVRGLAVGVVLAVLVGAFGVMAAKVHHARAAAAAHLAWADGACAAAGSIYQETDKKGRLVPLKQWGRACLAAIREAVRFRAEAGSQTAQIVTQHETEQAAKRDVDFDAARRSTDRTRRALKQMEAADAAVKDDNRVGADWFAGLNALGGLRGPLDAEAGGPAAGDGAAAEGSAAAGPPGLRPTP